MSAPVHRGALRIDNGRLFLGDGQPPLADGCVLVADGRIAFAGARADAPPSPPGTPRLDAGGGTILPGLIEAHWHATYFDVADLADLDIKYPAEYVALRAAANARLLLECGYTAARSGGSLFNVDVWLQRAIDEGIIPGPRLCPSGREICGRGGLMDWNPAYRAIGMDGLILLVDGADQARAAARQLVKDGAQWIKTYPTGDAAAPGANDQHSLSMTLEEMTAVAQTAHNHGRKVTGHCRATQGIKNAVRAGYDAIEHGTFIDDEALELILGAGIPVVPALYFEHASVARGREFGLSDAVIAGHRETLEAGADSARRLLRAGGRLGMGGDFGFAWNPHGDYARELVWFVREVGLSPLEVLTCATRTGAELMGRAHEIGSLAPGRMADVLVVDGDPFADIAVLADRARIRAVLQGGVLCAGRLAAAGLSACTVAGGIR